jgi:hypothetical protein
MLDNNLHRYLRENVFNKEQINIAERIEGVGVRMRQN